MVTEHLLDRLRGINLDDSVLEHRLGLVILLVLVYILILSGRFGPDFLHSIISSLCVEVRALNSKYGIPQSNDVSGPEPAARLASRLLGSRIRLLTHKTAESTKSKSLDQLAWIQETFFEAI